MTSTQLAALLATVGLAFLAQSIAWALLFRRVRALAERRATPPPVAEPPGAEALRAIEARLARLEAAGGVAGRAEAAAGEPRRPRRLDRQQVAVDGPVLITVPDLALVPSGQDAEAGAEFDRRFGGIWALADGGADAPAIARATGVPVGQVELILGLRGLQTGADPAGDGADG